MTQFEALVVLTQDTFGNFTAAANAALNETRMVTAIQRTRFFDEVVPARAYSQASALLGATFAAALNNLVALGAGSVAMQQRFGALRAQRLPFAQLSDDINTLSYTLDQLSAAVDILAQVHSMRERHCRGAPSRVLARGAVVPTRRGLDFVRTLERAREGVGLLSEAYSGNAAVDGLRVSLPNDVGVVVSELGPVQGTLDDSVEALVKARGRNHRIAAFASVQFLMRKRQRCRRC